MNSNTALLCEVGRPDISPPLFSGFASVAKSDPFQQLHERGFLEILLQDRTSGKNIIWATDSYAALGQGFGKKDCISPELLAGRHDELMRIRKESRLMRTRKHGEVFTPLSVCKLMCEHACKKLHGKDWKKFISATVLEITCGEAPFLASMKDLASGRAVPPQERIGILDRKLQVIGEKTGSREEWLAWAFKAFESTYGYEFQGGTCLWRE